MSKSWILLATAAVILAAVIGWQMMHVGVSPATLMEEALTSKESAARQQAAVRLISLNNAESLYAPLLQQSNDPAVRAIVVQGIADIDDFSQVETIFDLLDDPSPTVRASAVCALDRLMRCRTFIPHEGTPDERRAAVERAHRRWELIQQYELVDEVANATSLAYYYDQHTQTVFEGPSHLPSALETPGGPFEGMPAAVRAAMLSVDNSRDPSQRFVGWLSVDDYILENYGANLPERPADSESALIKRPGDSSWVYATSPAGKEVVTRALAAGKKALGREVSRCPRPGR